MVRRHGVGTGANHSGRRCDPVTFLLSTPRLFSDNPSSLTRPTQQALRRTCAAAVLALFPQGKVPPCGAHMAGKHSPRPTPTSHPVPRGEGMSIVAKALAAPGPADIKSG